MRTYEEMEYSNLSLQCERSLVNQLIKTLVEAGLPVTWKETKKFYTLSVQTSWSMQRLHFEKVGHAYRLQNKQYNIKDQRFAIVLQKFIQEIRGHAVLKLFSDGLLVVQNIRYGEPIRIVQIKGTKKKVLFEKECLVTMEQVLDAFSRTDAEQRIPVLKMEIDYELARLFDMLQHPDNEKISDIKATLEKLRLEMIMLEI